MEYYSQTSLDEYHTLDEHLEEETIYVYFLLSSIVLGSGGIRAWRLMMLRRSC
jgi:hypothetical protein